jgi:hypothetical protein
MGALVRNRRVELSAFESAGFGPTTKPTWVFYDWYARRERKGMWASWRAERIIMQGVRPGYSRGGGRDFTDTYWHR